MPSTSSFQRSVPSLHEIADINQLSHGNQDAVMEYKHFLRNYLEDIRGTKDALGFKQVIIFIQLTPRTQWTVGTTTVV